MPRNTERPIDESRWTDRSDHMHLRRTAALAAAAMATVITAVAALLAATPSSTGAPVGGPYATEVRDDIATTEGGPDSPATDAATQTDLTDTQRDQDTASPSLQPAPKATPTPPTTGSAPASQASPGPLTVSLDTDCRSPGQDQGVLVRATPGWQVTVNPRYADGQMGNIHGGLAIAEWIGPDGQFVHSWTIATTAPLGEVEVLVGVQSTTEEGDPITTSVSFLLAEAC